jgi:hypothetical protein
MPKRKNTKKAADPVREFSLDTKLAEILEFSEAEAILRKYNLPCLTCPMAKFEMQELSLGQVSGAYGLQGQKILDELNGALKVYTKKES